MTISIAIVGAGPAGSVAAALLAKRGFDVSLIYRSHDCDYKAGETMSPHVNDVLWRLGIRELLEQGPHISCPGNQSAFGAPRLVDVDFMYSSHGLGWHLDRVQFEKQLLEHANNRGALLLTDHTLTEVERAARSWRLLLKHGNANRTISADYVIDASGIARAFVRKLSTPINVLDKLAARTAVFDVPGDDVDHRTLIEAVEDGWWYSTTAPNKRRVVMFFGDTSDATFKACGDYTHFISHLRKTQHIWPKLQALFAPCATSGDHVSDETLKPHAFITKPASTTWADRIQGQGWLAIGDAAMSFDPLSSQGIYTALSAAEQAEQQVVSLHHQQKLSDDIISSDYTQWAEQTFGTYMQERSQYYAIEQRWTQSEFWARRQLNRDNVKSA